MSKKPLIVVCHGIPAIDFVGKYDIESEDFLVCPVELRERSVEREIGNLSDSNCTAFLGEIKSITDVLITNDLLAVGGYKNSHDICILGVFIHKGDAFCIVKNEHWNEKVKNLYVEIDDSTKPKTSITFSLRNKVSS